ncbi:28S ribosomal protein S31, mitochondrial [Copidosoma floridanum]|uniref:28S ribosomal protein S31, mitochondrial n=1 Tax=Copidosoma floridanum TaxID=29053 RepID=UPI0006C9D498|nr:28S ribosomal protein S31, mitochondrial [Copidosoma floridanum]
MLFLRSFPRCMSHYVKQSQLHTSVKFLSTDESSSSSSESSDSDSDKETKVNEPKISAKSQKNDEFLNSEKTNERLNALLLKISQNSTKVKETSKTDTTPAETTIPASTPGIIDVALKPRSVRFKKSVDEQKKNVPIEKQIIGAAKDVAKSMGGDTKKTEIELLGQILNLGEKEPQENKKTEAPKETSEQSLSLGDLLSSMKVDKPTVGEDRKKMMARKVGDRSTEKSVAGSLLYQKLMKKPSNIRAEPLSKVELNAPCTGLHIFKNMPKEEPQQTLRLLTWEEMEKKEMQMATFISPQNVFQELIQWTEQGKLWHFPINNEQGLEEEEKVHFTEHVFLERHLKDWCPKKGPISHFMELVCTGLSKNPYMTVEEKIGHITWYKNYFEDKKELLRETGALGEKEPLPGNQIAA